MLCVPNTILKMYSLCQPHPHRLTPGSYFSQVLSHSFSGTLGSWSSNYSFFFSSSPRMEDILRVVNPKLEYILDIRTQCCLKRCHTLEGRILFLLYFNNHSHSQMGQVYLDMKLLKLSCFCSIDLQLTLASFESHQTQPTWFHKAKM
uniref:Uncharacterized protein n=1 Tax=Mus musculus TaxID=10090 RepID=Q9D3B3_MOUSE|nr:unnamed protein product [Mus musculus]